MTVIIKWQMQSCQFNGVRAVKKKRRQPNKFKYIELSLITNLAV